MQAGEVWKNKYSPTTLVLGRSTRFYFYNGDGNALFGRYACCTVSLNNPSEWKKIIPKEYA